MNTCLDRSAILKVILRALETTNEARDERSQLVVSPEAPLFGADSTLDSLGLVALLIDIEEALAGEGLNVTLSDERALSQRRSPFRSVDTLAAYIEQLANEVQG